MPWLIILLGLTLGSCTSSYWADKADEEARILQSTAYVKSMRGYCAHATQDPICKPWRWNYGKE